MKFTVYSKNGCPYCTKIKQVLERANLEHIIYMLDENFSRDDFYNKFGQTTFPQVILNENHHIGGCVDTVNYLLENKII